MPKALTWPRPSIIVPLVSGLRWNLPSLGHVDAISASCVFQNVIAVLGKDPTVTYSMTIRLRGIVELARYSGGTNDGAFWQVGGTGLTAVTLPSAVPAIGAANGGPNATRNVYKLIIGTPPQTFYVNRMNDINGDPASTGYDPYHTYVIDYQPAAISIQGGSFIQMTADPSDGFERQNQDATGQPNLIAGIPPYPAAYDGQFCQLDVLSVV